MAETRIREALELLDGGRRWAGGTAFDGSNYCVLGALRAQWATDERGFCSDRAALYRIVEEQWPERVSIERICRVPRFNDHPDTTWTDIEVWMEKAAVMREEAVDG